MAGKDEEWVAHLGAGLILCCFGRYEEALSSLVRCHHLALHSESQGGSQCRLDVAARALHEAVGEICHTQAFWRAHSFLIPHFQRYYSCSRSARAWSALFVGWAATESFQLLNRSYEDQVRWLKRSLDLAAGSPDRDSLCYIECFANELIFKSTLGIEWQTKLHHLKMQKEAAARWGKLDEEVYALYQYAIVCHNNYQHAEAVESREQLCELVNHGNDALLQAMSDCICGFTAYRFGRKEECLDCGMRVMSLLDDPKALAKSWSSYFGYCARARGNFKASPSSPTRDERLFMCLENALCLIIYAACYMVAGETEVAIALAALAKHKQLMRRGGMFRTTETRKFWHLEKLCDVYTSLSRLKKESQWSDRAESILAETLKLSLAHGEWRIHIKTLRTMVRLAGYMRTDYRFYLQPGSDQDCGHFKMIDSFLGEAERLGRQHFSLALLDVLQRRAYLSFRMQTMDKVIQILEPLGKALLGRSYKLGSFSKDRILYNDWESWNFEMLHAALISCQQPDRAIMWAERERAQDLLHSIKVNHSAAHVFEELMEFNVDDDKALEEINSISRDAGEATAFLVYTTVGHFAVGICGVLLHYTAKQAWFTKFEPGLNIYASVHNTIDDFSKNCNDLNRLQQWYERLILPFEEQLEMIKPKKLVIVPGKHLTGLPFAALLKGPGEPFLIQRYAISYIPSLRMYSRCKRRGEALMESSRRRTALVIGNPSVDPRLDLPFAEEEAIRTKDLLERAGFRDILLLQRDHATRSAVLERLPTSEWIHYAGHAAVTSDFPRGALLLAPESSAPLPEEECTRKEQNEWNCSPGDSDLRGLMLLRHLRGRPSSEVLTGDDIETCGVEVRALVTVLSACQSGLGEVFSEGVLGLYRALHVVGAPSVLCSLWNVDDKCTMVIMGKLYERLLAGRELSIAFQEVVVELINEDAGEECLVSNWAGFIISGNPEMKLRNVTL